MNVDKLLENISKNVFTVIDKISISLAFLYFMFFQHWHLIVLLFAFLLLIIIIGFSEKDREDDTDAGALLTLLCFVVYLFAHISLDGVTSTLYYLFISVISICLLFGSTWIYSLCKYTLRYYYNDHTILWKLSKSEFNKIKELDLQGDYLIFENNIYFKYTDDLLLNKLMYL